MYLMGARTKATTPLSKYDHGIMMTTPPDGGVLRQAMDIETGTSPSQV